MRGRVLVVDVVAVHGDLVTGFDDRAFYDLFDRPRDTWHVPVLQLSDVDGFVPFAAWLERPDRVEY